MLFSNRDLSNQFISTSYQDVVQRYATGSNTYLLDGIGYEILGIPSSSIGNLIVTQEQTITSSISASYSLSSSYSNNSDSSSYSLNSLYSVDSIYSTVSQYSSQSFTASYILGNEVDGNVNSASYALSASWAPGTVSSISASWASSSISASYAPNLYPQTYQSSASWASASVSSSYTLTASFLIGSSPSSPSSSWASQSISSSYSLSSSWTPYQISSSWSLTASYAPTVTNTFFVSGSNTASYYSCQAYSDISQSISADIFTPVNYNINNWDDFNFHNTSSNNSRFTVPYSGKYRVSATAYWADSVTPSDRYACFCINGNTTQKYGYSIALPTQTGLGIPITTTAILTLSSGDYVQFLVFSNDTTYTSIMNDAGNISGGTPVGLNRFTIEYIGVYGSTLTTSSYAVSASYSLNGGGSSLTTGSTYPITSSWALQSLSANTSSVSIASTTSDFSLLSQTSVSSSYALTTSFVSYAISTQTSSYQILSTDYTILMSGSSALSITLPSVSNVPIGKIYNIKNLSNYSLTITGSQYIDNNPFQIISSSYTSIEVQTDGIVWWII